MAYQGAYCSTPNLVFMGPGQNVGAGASTAHPQPCYARSMAAPHMKYAPRGQTHVYTVSDKMQTDQPTVMIIQDVDMAGKTELIYVLLAALSGTFMATGWWLAIDATVVYLDVIESHFLYHSPGIVGTVYIGTMAFLLVNAVSDEYLATEFAMQRPRASRVAMLTLFVGWFMAFGALLGAAYIMVNDYLMTDRAQWPGIAIFMQNLFIFFATLTYRLLLCFKWKAYHQASVQNM